MLNVGDYWKEWKVDSVVGSGQFGKVYRLVRNEFGHTYESALKVIRIPRDDTEYRNARSEGMDDEAVKAYYRSVVDEINNECTLMYELKGNSYIVSYEGHQVVPVEDSVGWEIYIQMELLKPLTDIMLKAPLDENQAINLGIDICHALEICHGRNIIHRDIKPENTFLSKQGNYKLGDFGIARRMENATIGMSQKGTVSYMAPEVYTGKPYNKTVDIYSLGIMLYRLMNHNRLPFYPQYPEKLYYKDRERATSLRLSGVALPNPSNASDAFAEIILKACAYKADDRYHSAAEMREDLEKLKRTAYTNPEVIKAVNTQPMAEPAIPETYFPEEKTVDDISYAIPAPAAVINRTEYERNNSSVNNRDGMTRTSLPKVWGIILVLFCLLCIVILCMIVVLQIAPDSSLAMWIDSIIENLFSP